MRVLSSRTPLHQRDTHTSWSRMRSECTVFHVITKLSNIRSVERGPNYSMLSPYLSNIRSVERGPTFCHVHPIPIKQQICLEGAHILSCSPHTFQTSDLSREGAHNLSCSPHTFQTSDLFRGGPHSVMFTPYLSNIRSVERGPTYSMFRAEHSSATVRFIEAYLKSAGWALKMPVSFDTVRPLSCKLENRGRRRVLRSTTLQLVCTVKNLHSTRVYWMRVCAWFVCHTCKWCV